MVTFTMILQLCIVLGALWVGSRYGSLALGAISVSCRPLVVWTG